LTLARLNAEKAHQVEVKTLKDQVIHLQQVVEERLFSEVVQARLAQTEVAEGQRGLLAVMRDAGREMVQRADARDARLDEIRESVERAPEAVWALGDPRLDTLRGLLEQMLSDMEGRIIGALPRAAENAAATVLREVNALRTEGRALVAQIQDIARTLDRFDVPPASKECDATADRQPGESTGGLDELSEQVTHTED
jgi:hypothetical protein